MVCGIRSSEMYAGARPCSALKAMKRILKRILDLTSKQCEEAKIGEISECRLVLVRSLAAAN